MLRGGGVTSSTRAHQTVPRVWSDITPDWLTPIIRSRCAAAVVAEVDLGDIDIGTTSRTVARLKYSAGDGPNRVFIKAQGSLSRRLLLAAMGTLFGEARVLGERQLLPLQTPEVYGSFAERRTLRTITVMEDVTTRGAKLNEAADPLTPDEAAGALEQLAGLHGAYWDAPLPRALAWVKPWRMGPGYYVFGALAPRRGAEKLRAAGLPDLLPTIPWTARSGVALVRHSCRLAGNGPQTLLHGDAHVGNTYQLPDGSTGFYDWQFVRRGSWVHDVGYLMISALDVDDRRTHEQELLRGYLDTLAKTGADIPTFDDAWRRYRQSPVYGLVIWLGVYALSGLQQDTLALATIGRFARAFDDLDSGAFLGDGREHS